MEKDDSKKLILIIEDDPDVANLIIHKLRNANYKTLWAEYANQGIQLAYREKPDLIILDIMLPEGSGISVFEYIKQSPFTNQIPVIVLTAVENAHKSIELDKEHDCFIKKPFESNVLVEKINAFLNPPMKEYASKKILLVDDDRDLGKLIASKLKKENLSVITVEDALQGMRFARHENPDLILLDIMLPGGNGISMLKQLKKLMKTRFIPVIILTASEEPHLRLQARELGAEDFLEKPIDFDDLIDRIRALL